MKSAPLVYTLIIALTLQTIHAWYFADSSRKSRSSSARQLREEEDILNYIRNVKRTNGWAKVLCGKHNDMCSTGGVISCCSGYTCKCNFWNSNCRCKNKLFRG